MLNWRRAKRTKAASVARSEEHEFKVDNYAAAVSGACWIVLGLCAAAVVLSTGRDEAARYRSAQAELRAISKFSANINQIYAQVAEKLNPTMVPLLTRAVNDAAAKVGAEVDGTALSENLSYFLVDEGPLAISFDGAPTDLTQNIDRFLNSPRYVVKVPAIVADPSGFARDLLAAMEQSGVAGRVIIGLEFSCNYGGNQCRGELTLRSSPLSFPDRKEFYVPAKTMVVELRPYTILGFATEQEARSALASAAIASIENEFLGKNLAASYDYLAEKIAEKEGSIKVFDFSFSGLAAYFAVPIGIIFSLGFLYMHLQEMSAAPISASLLRNEAVYFFYTQPVNAVVVQALILIAPTFSLLLIARMARESDWWTFASILGMAMVSAILSVGVARLRRGIIESAIAHDAAKAAP